MNPQTCLICSGALRLGVLTASDAYTRERFQIARCRRCGAGFTYPIPDDLARYYQNYHGGRHGFTKSFCDLRRRRISERYHRNRNQSPGDTRRLVNDTAIHTSGDPPTLLDVGCGEGSFIHRMARGGWQVVGVDKFAEPAGKDTDVATSIASTIAIVGSIDEIVHPQPFDLITAWHVLEHLDNLDDLLDQIKPRLASDGTFIFAVPNARSIQARVFAGHWLHLDVPRHLIHFSFQSLQRVMEKHGFEIQRHRGSEWEYDIVGWLQSALNAMGAEQNGLLQRLGGKSTATDNGELDLLSRGFQRFISAMRFAIASGVTMLATIEVFSTGWMGRGGTLIVVARHSRDTQST